MCASVCVSGATSYGNNTNYTTYGANDVDVALFGGNNKSQARAQFEALVPVRIVCASVQVCEEGVCVSVCVCGTILLPVSDFNAFISLCTPASYFPFSVLLSPFAFWVFLFSFLNKLFTLLLF